MVGGAGSRAVNLTIAAAISNRHLLQLSYDGYMRIVEPHAYGVSSAQHEIMRVWQTGGGSASNEPTGWKLLRVDEIRTLTTLPQTFAGPRPGYRRGDRDMAVIYSQL